MAGLVPAIHAFPSETTWSPATIGPKGVDARDKPEHDGLGGGSDVKLCPSDESSGGAPITRL
jgi:hypothetical protein